MVLSTIATFMVRGETTMRLVCIVSCVINAVYFAMCDGDMFYALTMEVTLFAINVYYLVRDWLKGHELDIVDLECRN